MPLFPLSLAISQMAVYSVLDTSLPVLRKDRHICYVANTDFELLILLSL